MGLILMVAEAAYYYGVVCGRVVGELAIIRIMSGA
jgi:hypothetical protein